jgi:hypothetical protein
MQVLRLPALAQDDNLSLSGAAAHAGGEDKECDAEQRRGG